MQKKKANPVVPIGTKVVLKSFKMIPIRDMSIYRGEIILNQAVGFIAGTTEYPHSAHIPVDYHVNFKITDTMSISLSLTDSDFDIVSPDCLNKSTKQKKGEK